MATSESGAPIDLVVRATSTYYNNNRARLRNGCKALAYGVINVETFRSDANAVDLEFTFEDAATGGCAGTHRSSTSGSQNGGQSAANGQSTGTGEDRAARQS